MTNDSRLLLSSKEAAKLLSISERTLFTITSAGQLPCIRIMGAKRYSRSDLERFIEQQRTTAQKSASGEKPESQPMQVTDSLE